MGQPHSLSGSFALPSLCMERGPKVHALLLLFLFFPLRCGARRETVHIHPRGALARSGLANRRMPAAGGLGVNSHNVVQAQPADRRFTTER